MLPPWIASGPEKAESYYKYTEEFLHWWNEEADEAAFSPEVRAKLQELFDIAKFYSPYPEDRAAYAHYKSEQDVDQAFSALLEVVRVSE